MKSIKAPYCRVLLHCGFLLYYVWQLGFVWLGVIILLYFYFLWAVSSMRTRADSVCLPQTPEHVSQCWNSDRQITKRSTYEALIMEWIWTCHFPGPGFHSFHVKWADGLSYLWSRMRIAWGYIVWWFCEKDLIYCFLIYQRVRSSHCAQW